jgi:hypothetical protein
VADVCVAAGVGFCVAVETDAVGVGVCVGVEVGVTDAIGGNEVKVTAEEKL